MDQLQLSKSRYFWEQKLAHGSEVEKDIAAQMLEWVAEMEKQQGSTPNPLSHWIGGEY